MTETIITVQGSHSAWFPAERATVTAAVHTDGPDRAVVFARALEASEAVRALVESDFDKTAGPITWWSSDAVRVWFERPWNNEGKQLDPVYHAAVDFSVKFSDFEVLANWVESTSEIESATIGSIAWDLTEATRTSATVEVRSRAVKDAIAKASVYAQSIGLATVKAIALADPGMLGDPSAGSTAPVFARASMMSALGSREGGAQLALKPEEIAVASTVDARFVAS